MRIASLLPSATEILYALGAGDELVAISEKCDYPDAVRSKTVVVRSRIDDTRSQEEIHAQVQGLVAAGEALYEVDLAALARLQCDLLITQDVCHVCAASPHDLEQGLCRLDPAPQVVALHPCRLDEVWQDVETLGEAIGRPARGHELAAALRAAVAARIDWRGAAAAATPRVLCLEWFMPPFIAGHWVPDMVACAGGLDALGMAGQPGFACDWERVLASRPDAIVLMPCGYHLDEVERQAREFVWPEGWQRLDAVRAGNVFVVDASGQFSRHGPRLADGVQTLREILAAFHRHDRSASGGNSWRRLTA